MRHIIYQHVGSDSGFRELRIVWEEGTPLVILYYETPRAASFGTVLEVPQAAAFLERMQREQGHPWNSPVVTAALEALARLARPASEPDEASAASHAATAFL